MQEIVQRDASSIWALNYQGVMVVQQSEETIATHSTSIEMPGNNPMLPHDPLDLSQVPNMLLNFSASPALDRPALVTNNS